MEPGAAFRFQPMGFPLERMTMSPRAHAALSWTGLISLIGLLVSVITGSIRLGRRDAVIDQKVDRSVYQQDQTQLAKELGEMHGDVRVIRAVLCEKKPGACQ